MHVIFNLLNVSWNLYLKVSVLCSQFDDFSLKNRSLVSEVDFLLIKFLDSVTVVNRFLKTCDFLLQMLIVWIRLERIFFFLGLQHISLDFFVHLVDDCFDSFVSDGIKFLTDVFDADLVEHFSDEKLGLFIFLLFLLFRLFVDFVFVGCSFLLNVFELLWERFDFVVELIFGCFGVLLFLTKLWSIVLDGFRGFELLGVGSLLCFGLSGLEMFGFFLGLRGEVGLVLSFLFDGDKGRELLFLLVVHDGRGLGKREIY